MYKAEGKQRCASIKREREREREEGREGGGRLKNKGKEEGRKDGKRRKKDTGASTRGLRHVYGICTYMRIEPKRGLVNLT